MSATQPGILAEETQLARYLSFSIHSTDDIRASLSDLVQLLDPATTVCGFGLSLINVLGKEIPELRSFPAHTANGIDIPSTPSALWCWLRGNDRGEIYHRARKIEQILADNFILDDVLDSFQYDGSRDMSGYEDGTENPVGDDAITAAIVAEAGAGMNGSSFVAVQQWVHDFDQLESMSQLERDHAIGRQLSDNEEIEDAPLSAHVKRTAQEDFEPEAFILRRSMPWAEGMEAGLYFVSFTNTLDKFEAQLNRMLGIDDGVVDALFDFTRPISGAYYWCPPIKDNKLDLSMLGI